MKTILLILPLAGVALLAAAGEPAKPETASAPTNLSAENNATKSAAVAKGGGLDAADKAASTKLGEKVARSDALTTKSGHSVTKSFMQSLNPFAPVKPAPTTPWLSRAAWSTASEHGVASSTPVEVRHEAKCGVVVCSQ